MPITRVSRKLVSGPNVESSRPIAMNLTELVKTNVSTYTGYMKEKFPAFTRTLHEVLRNRNFR